MNLKKWGVLLGLAIGLSFVTPVGADAEQYKDDVFIIYKNDNGKQLIENSATRIIKDYVPMKTVKGVFSEAALQKLKQSKDIAVVEETPETFETQNTSASQLTAIKNPTWNIAMTATPQLWKSNLTGQGVNVAIIDTGVADLPMFTNVTRLSYVTDNKATGYDESTVIDDSEEGHGTSVASVIKGAQQPFSMLENPLLSEVMTKQATYTFSGIAPNVNLYSMKVFVKNEDAEMEPIVDAIMDCIQRNIQVINLSLGTESDDPILRNAIKTALNAGIVVVAASGNDSTYRTIAPLNYPANYSDVVAVGAVNYDLDRAEFSNGGKNLDIVAPGQDIPVIDRYGQKVLQNGTSFASPHIAAYAALLLQKNPLATASQIEKELKKYTVDLGTKGVDNLYGYGVIDFSKYMATPITEDKVEQPKPETVVTLPTNSDNPKVVTQSDAQKFIAQNQVSITKWITTIQKGKKLNLHTQFTPLYSLYYDLAKPEQNFIQKYRKKIKAVMISSSTKSSKLKATNLTTMAKKKTTKLTFTTAIKPSSLSSSKIYVYRAGKKVSGFTLKKASNGKTIQLTTKKTLAKGKYVIVIDPSNLKTKKGKKITTPFIIKFTVK